jgi:hypothetical protein
VEVLFSKKKKKKKIGIKTNDNIEAFNFLFPLFPKGKIYIKNDFSATEPTNGFREYKIIIIN